MNRSPRPLLVAFFSLTALSLTAHAGEFKVAGTTFTAPKEFTSVKPKSAMRKAQFTVAKLAAQGEIVFFYFGPGGAGGVDANVKRWLGQFDEPKDKINAKTEKAKGGEVPVTFVSAQGTFMGGPPNDPIQFRHWGLLGAILETKEGAVFAKFTGPEHTVKEFTTAFKKMIAGAK
jgi:hypothetical protein